MERQQRPAPVGARAVPRAPLSPLIVLLLASRHPRIDCAAFAPRPPPPPPRRCSPPPPSSAAAPTAAARPFPRSASRPLPSDPPGTSSSSSSAASAFASAASGYPAAADGDEPLWRAEATELIWSAAVAAGADESKLAVEWKPGLVRVTVGGEIRLGGGGGWGAGEEEEDFEDEPEIYGDDDLGLIDDEDYEEVYSADGDGPVGDGGYAVDEDEGGKPSITSIARAINAALYRDSEENGELSVGNHVATTHEIEVTTPGASDVLEGEVMFEAYRGFDVIVETSEVKKGGKKRVVEGKLVEKDDDFTQLNVKGRIVKVKNQNVECVRLPKAKREKRAK